MAIARNSAQFGEAGVGGRNLYIGDLSYPRETSPSRTFLKLLANRFGDKLEKLKPPLPPRERGIWSAKTR